MLWSRRTTPGLASSEELELIGKLRSEFEAEFKRREAEGLDHPCLFGEIALLRVLRGNDGDLEKSIAWFRSFLEGVQTYEVDALVRNMTARLDESGSDFGHVSMLPHYEVVEKCFRVVVTAPQLSQKGDVVQYIPAVDFDKQGIVEEMDWKHWVEFMRSLMVLQCIVCDRQSRLQKRVVRLAVLVDVYDSPLDKLGYGPYDRDHNQDIDKFVKEILAELVDKVYVVNASWRMSTVFNLLSRFVPEKFTKKVQVQSDNGTVDTAFAELMGGQEQLEALYATRVGLTLQREPREDLAESDPWPTERELEIVAMLRDDFKEELDKRKEDGRDYPFLFGDLALTRVLRGTGGSYRAAAKWFSNLLAQMEAWNMDDTIQELLRKSATTEPPTQFRSLDIVPFYEEFRDMVSFVPTAPQPTPSGDLVCYIPLNDMNLTRVLEEGNWEHWVQFQRCIGLLRLMQLNGLSHEQQRLARVVIIWDLDGVPWSQLRNADYMEKHQKDISSVWEQLCIEIAGTQYVLNAPWIVARVFNLFSSFMPEKFSRKFQMWSSDGTGDEELTEKVGGKEQLQELLATKVGIVDDAPDEREAMSGERTIVAGEALERLQELRAGQLLKWDFEVVAGYGDGLLGISDVEFSASFLDIPEVAVGERLPTEFDESGRDIAVAAMVRPQDEHSTGSYRAEADGLAVLRWSNKHSTLRSKTINFSMEVEDGAGDAPGSETGGGAPQLAQADLD